MPRTHAALHLQQFMAAHDGTSIDRFAVAGASKRGWTTWTVGAVDPRVAMISPIVMDELNFLPNGDLAFCTWGTARVAYFKRL